MQPRQHQAGREGSLACPPDIDPDDRNTVYLFPNRALRTGNRIADFKALPRGVHMFLPVGSS